LHFDLFHCKHLNKRKEEKKKMGRTTHSTKKESIMAKKAPRKSIPVSKKSSIDGPNMKLKRRTRPGMKSLKEIKHYQSTVDTLIPKKRMVLLIRELATEESLRHALLEGGIRFSKTGLEALRIASESYLVDFFVDAYKNTIHRRCVTLELRDLFKTMDEGGWRKLHGERSNAKMTNSGKIYGSLKATTSKRKRSDESEEKPQKSSLKKKSEGKSKEKKNKKGSSKKGESSNVKNEQGETKPSDESETGENGDSGESNEKEKASVKEEGDKKQQSKQVKSVTKKVTAQSKRKQKAPKKVATETEKEPDSPQNDFHTSKADRSKSPSRSKSVKKEETEKEKESPQNSEEEEPAYRSDSTEKTSDVTPWQEPDDDFDNIYSKISKFTAPKKGKADN
jgi:histone H3/H4